jgi:lantibiotic modifying enzyme
MLFRPKHYSYQGFGHNRSLCHGDLGNLELLLKVSETLDDSQWRAQVR